MHAVLFCETWFSDAYQQSVHATQLGTSGQVVSKADFTTVTAKETMQHSL